MANFVYNEAKRAIIEGEIDLGAGGSDVRVLLVMTNTTADTEDDVNTISGFTTLDELNDTGYARQALAGEAVNEDAGNNRAEADADDVAFTYNGDGSRNTQAAVYLKHVTNDTDSVPIAFVDTGGFPVNAAQTGTVTIQHNAEGWLQAA